MIHFLSLEEVLELHDQVIEEFGGIYGIRDRNLLESAVAQPELFIFGSYVHPEIYDMAAAYLFHIIKNHPFCDGNKRTGLVAAIIFLKINGFSLTMDFDSLYDLTIKVACSELYKEQIAAFFSKNIK